MVNIPFEVYFNLAWKSVSILRAAKTIMLESCDLENVLHLFYYIFCSPTQDVNIEACEQLFPWLSKFAPIKKQINRRGFLFLKLYLLDNHNRDVDMGSEGVWFHNYSGAPWVRKCGKLPIRENLAITWLYTDRPSAQQAYQHKISSSLLWWLFGAKTNGNPRFVKHQQLRNSGKSTQNQKRSIRNLLF